MIGLTSAALFALSLVADHVIAQEATPGPGKFFFMWPTQVSQCQLVNLTWGAGAVAPFQAWVVPIGQQPFIYQIPASAYVNGQGAYQLQVQLNQGTNYVMLMSDARGIGSGGTSALQIVGSSANTACLNTASRNQTSKSFSYSVAGKAQQCTPGFELQWDGSPDQSPYNFTVIPLTQKYYPFDVKIQEDSGYSSDWIVNMTSGTRFTVLMNNKDRYGSGGAAGIYEVASNTSAGTACITQSAMGTGAWPVGVATNTLALATNSVRPTSRPSAGITGGAIAGIVIGIIALLALIAILVWFLLRRKRRAALGRHNEGKATELDLADDRSVLGDDGDDGATGGEGRGYSDSQVGPVPLVSPYPTSSGIGGGRYSAIPISEDSGGRRNEVEMSESGTMTSAGFAGLGVAGSRERDSRFTMGEIGKERRGSGMAGPLPTKSTLGPSSSSQSQSQQYSRPSNSPPLASPLPISPLNPSSSSNSKRERDRANQTALSSSLPPGASQGGGMRIMNHDRPDELPAIAPISQGYQGGGGGTRRPRDRGDQDIREMQFRRHEDAGRVDIVDLPPLYTDVPREGRRIPEGDEIDGQDIGERTPLSAGGYEAGQLGGRIGGGR